MNLSRSTLKNFSIRELKIICEKAAKADIDELFENSPLGKNKTLRRNANLYEKAKKEFAITRIVFAIEKLEEARKNRLEKNKKDEGENIEDEAKCAELQEKMREEEEKLLKGWNAGKRKIKQYTFEDNKKVQDKDAEISRQELTLNKEEREYKQDVKKNETFFGIISNETKAFGMESKAYPVDKYDDYFNDTDVAVKIGEKGPILLIDLKHYQHDIPDDLLKNLKNPIKKLSYPTDQSLENPGIPILVGIKFERMKELIKTFLEERVNAQEPQSSKRAASYFLELILPQLKEQKRLLKHASPEVFKQYNISAESAEEIYDKTIEYLQKLKRSLPSSKIDENDPWFMLLGDPASTIRRRYPHLSL